MGEKTTERLTPWPSMRGDAQNTGCWISPVQAGLPLVWGIAQPAVVDAAQGVLNATPVIGSDGTVYVGSSDGFVYRLAPGAPPGEPLRHPIRMAPEGQDPQPVDSAGTFTPSGRVFFPAADRALHGGRPVRDEDQAFPGIDVRAGPEPTYSSIDWLEGNVVSLPGPQGETLLFAGCDNFYFHALRDTSSGTATSLVPVWSIPTGFFIWSAAAFTTDGKTGCFASADLSLYGFDPASGQVRWTGDLGNMCASSPAITKDGRAWVGAFDGKVYAFDTRTGKGGPVYETGSLIYASPALYEDQGTSRLFVLSSDGCLRAFDITSGNPSRNAVWTVFTGMPGFSSPVVGADPARPSGYLVYVATGDGVVWAVDPDGRLRSRFDVAALPGRNDGETGDPACWASLQYPAINSSLALGPAGVTAVVSSGAVATIPYDGLQEVAAAWPDLGKVFYIAPSGRMMREQIDGQRVAIDCGQVLTFALVSKAGFADLSRAGAVAMIDNAPVKWHLSVDNTLLHVEAPMRDTPFTVQISVHGQAYSSCTCVPRPVVAPLTPAQLRATEWHVTRMSIFTPFAVPALDQLAIATVEIRLRILSAQDVGSGVYQVQAYGCEQYVANRGDRPRNLLYAFRGTYSRGTLRLATGTCYFELSAMPITLSTFELTACVAQGGAPGRLDARGVSLVATYAPEEEETQEWLLDVLTKWFNGSRPLPVNAPIVERFGKFLARLYTLGWQAFVGPWKLMRNDRRFRWTGTFTLRGKPLKRVGVEVLDASAGAASVQFRVRLPASGSQPGPVSGILLFDEQGLLDLPYGHLNMSPQVQNDNTVLFTLSLSGLGSEGIPRDVPLVAKFVHGAHVADRELGFTASSRAS